MDYEEKMLDTILNAIESLRDDVKGMATHCETVCVNKFADKDVEPKINKLWEWKFFIAGGAAVMMFLIGMIEKVI